MMRCTFHLQAHWQFVRRAEFCSYLGARNRACRCSWFTGACWRQNTSAPHSFIAILSLPSNFPRAPLRATMSKFFWWTWFVHIQNEFPGTVLTVTVVFLRIAWTGFFYALQWHQRVLCSPLHVLFSYTFAADATNRNGNCTHLMVCGYKAPPCISVPKVTYCSAYLKQWPFQTLKACS